MIGPGWGKPTNETAFDHATTPDLYVPYEHAFTETRKVFCAPDYRDTLLSRLPANSAWGDDDPGLWPGHYLYGVTATGVDPSTPDFDEGFVLEMPGPYSAADIARPNQWALVDPTDFYVTGDVPIWAQPIPIEEGQYYDFGGTAGAPYAPGPQRSW